MADLATGPERSLRERAAHAYSALPPQRRTTTRREAVQDAVRGAERESDSETRIGVLAGLLGVPPAYFTDARMTAVVDAIVALRTGLDESDHPPWSRCEIPQQDLPRLLTWHAVQLNHHAGSQAQQRQEDD